MPCSDDATGAAGRSACSHPTGVAKPRTEKTAQKPIVRCIDGTLSAGSGRAACSRHGGLLGPGKIPMGPTSPRPSQRADRAMTRCNDGTLTATTGRTACSRHGGIAATRESRLGEPLAVCRDGWISYSAHGGGTCEDHGGVREWLGA